MDETRAALYRWMSGVMLERDWTANAWARHAAVTPTNLTRFLKDPVSGSLPSAETLGALARAAGSEPRFLVVAPSDPAVVRVPLLSLEQARDLRHLQHREAERFLDERRRGNGPWLPLDRPVSRRAFALVLTSPSLNAAGVFPDDRVVVEPLDVAPPKAGDVVVVVDNDHAHALRWFPPYLLPVSTDSSLAPITCDQALVAGAAVWVVRSLHPCWVTSTGP
ncbi:MAG TPA: XRE family transcriptional regulator [Azospirillaceae bacterium]|nr:XRE family transcriptional regulator [Azospirillaceae bacterium]